MNSTEKLRDLASHFTTEQIRAMTDFIVRVRNEVTKGQIVAQNLWKESQILIDSLEKTSEQEPKTLEETLREFDSRLLKLEQPFKDMEAYFKEL